MNALKLKLLEMCGRKLKVLMLMHSVLAINHEVR